MTRGAHSGATTCDTPLTPTRCSNWKNVYVGKNYVGRQKRSDAKLITADALLRYLHALAAFGVLRPKTGSPDATLSLRLDALLLRRDVHWYIDAVALADMQTVLPTKSQTAGLCLSCTFTQVSKQSQADRLALFGRSLGARYQLRLRGAQAGCAGNFLLAHLVAHSFQPAQQPVVLGTCKEAATWLLTPPLDEHDAARAEAGLRAALECCCKCTIARAGCSAGCSLPAAVPHSRVQQLGPDEWTPPTRTRGSSPSPVAVVSHLCGRAGCLCPWHLRWLTRVEDAKLRTLHKRATQEMLRALAAPGAKKRKRKYV